MHSSKYTIGVDFGSKSARAVLFDIANGQQIQEAVKDYSHGVIDKYLPCSKEKLPHDWALQDPADYIEALKEIVFKIVNNSGICADDVIGISIGFTSCTMLPLDEKGEPLCFKDEFKNNPHSYVKMWKHHAAQKEANMLNRIAEERGEDFLRRYGGKISSEWLIPKIWQILNEAPEIYRAANKFMEAADWLVFQLTGEEKRNICMAGLKAIWSKESGYPSKQFFKNLDPRLENLVEEKLANDIYPLDAKAGYINSKWTEITGLNRKTVVAVSRIDGHSAVPAVGITHPGNLLMIIGTSTGHLVLNESEKMIPGISGVVNGGIVPGYIGYEAGQSCTGDLFEWFVKNCIPVEYGMEACERKICIHKLLREKASAIKAGESGLIALDWWNGNRSILADADLTGLIVGYTLLTRAEEIYRALIEATAYGTRIIIETYEEYGIEISQIYAAGGIAEKDEFLLQIYADVINKEIILPDLKHACCLGSAMFAAVAAGKDAGGFDSISDAAKVMAKVDGRIFRPNIENTGIYDELYAEYKKLHDYFGRGENNVMKTLKELKVKVANRI